MSCFQTSVLGIIVLGVMSSAKADQMFDAMISTDKVDFGVIATGTEVPKYIRVRNIYQQTVVISEVKTSCACASATVDKQVLQPGETAKVTVKMNTRSFSKKKDSNVLIRFSSPRYYEARIPVEAYIRTDLVITPGSAQFGNIDKGADGRVVLDIAYAGRSDWDIDDIKINNPHLTARLKPTEQGTGSINYQLELLLDAKAPAGPIRDMITIVTNDGGSPNVPLLVDGQVVPDIAVSPPIVNFERLPAGATSVRNIVLKGKKPFAISSIEGDKLRDSVSATVAPKTSPVHVVPIRFRAPATSGPFKDTLTVKVAGRKEPIEVNIIGSVAP